MIDLYAIVSNLPDVFAGRFLNVEQAYGAALALSTFLGPKLLGFSLHSGAMNLSGEMSVNEAIDLLNQARLKPHHCTHLVGVKS